MAKKSRSVNKAVSSFNLDQADDSGANLHSLRTMLNADDLAVARYNAGQATACGMTLASIRPDLPAADVTALNQHIGFWPRYSAGQQTVRFVMLGADDVTGPDDLTGVSSQADGTTAPNYRFVMPAADDFTSVDAEPTQAPTGGPVPAAFTSALGTGDVAVVGYNTGQSDGNGTTADSIQIVLTEDVASGTVIFLTDRSWNGSAFSNSAGDGTTTYTFATNLVAGTVINVPINGTFDPEQTGEAIYIYQGSDADTPIRFLYAIEIADGNTTFNASLANTGLVVGTNAVAIALDSATYSGPTTEAFSYIYNGKSLLQNISDPSNWVGDDADGQKALDQPDLTGPLGLAADFSLWAAGSGGGGGVVGVSGDTTANGGNSGINLVQLFTNLQISGVNVLYAPQDIVFDTVHGKYFIADSDISGGHNRVLMGNISDLIGNSGSLVAPTVLFSDVGTTASSRIFNLQVDANNGIVYFDHGQGFDKVKYDGTGHVQLANFGALSGNPNGTTNNFIDDFVINFATGDVYLSSHRVTAAADGDAVSRNYIYKISGLDANDIANAFSFGGGNITVLPFSPDDDDSGVLAVPGEAFPQEYGTVEGLALSADGNTLYIVAAKILYDNDGDGGFSGPGGFGTPPILTQGGIFGYSLVSNGSGNFSVIYQPTDDGDSNSQTIQPGFGPQGLLDDIEIDPVTGKLYFLDQTGDQLGITNPPGDEGIWRIDTDGTPDPVFFQGISNINGLAPTNLFFNHAPTVTSHSEATPGVTEASNGPGSGLTSLVQPFLTLDVTDAETASLTDQLAGAVVRISSNFQSGATHQDTLTIGGQTNGTLGTGISFNYNAATGVMILSGANTFNNYEAAIALVRFNTSGDDPTAFGTAQSRSISWSVTDGLNQSDEVSTSITVTGINDAPVNGGLTGTYSAVEDVSLALTGISVSDVDTDAASQNIVVTLSVAHGVLTLLTNVAGGITAGMITAGANGSGSVTLTGTQNQINATLAAASGLVYSPTADYNGADALTFVTNDQGFNGNDPGLTGTGTSEQDSDTKVINISAVVDITNDSVTVTEDSGANTLALFANDTFENSTRFISAVTQGSHGSVTINNNGTVGDATDDFVVYTVTDANYNGTDSFTYTVTSPAGVIETATVNVTVSAVNDPIGTAAPGAISLSEDATNFAVAGLSITDVDAALAPAGVYNVTLSSTHGTMTLTTLAGLTFTAGDGTSDATMTFHGTLAAINTALATASYTPTANYNGLDAAGIVLQATDTFGGIVATGSGAATNDSDSINVTVTAVNDVPAFAALNGTPTFTEGGAAVTLDSNATVSDADLAVLNGGNGDYGGTVLTVARQGGANASDLFQFAASGSFTVNGGNLEAGGLVFASFTNSGGAFTITFNSAATPATSARVNAVLDAIQYANSSDNPPASAVIGYTFSDGNAGAQGPGGAGIANGSVTVTITAVDDPAVAVNDGSSTNENATVNVAVLTNDSDPDGPLSVIKINGTAIVAGQTLSLASGATVKLNADGTLTYDPNHKFDTLTSTSTGEIGAVNTSALDSFTYSLGGAGGGTATVSITVNGVASPEDHLEGDAGNNNITGTGNGDFFYLDQGGIDAASGLGGNDVFLFGATLTAADVVDGGAGTDQVAIQGNYIGVNSLTLGTGIVSVESLAILPGNDTRFGDPGSNFYSYNITTVDQNVAPGVQMTVDANRLRAGENFTFNGAAELDGSFFIYGGMGVDLLTGGSQNDVFLFGTDGGGVLRWGGSDQIIGGAGIDQLALRGEYSVTFGATQLLSIESIGLVSAHDTRFGALGAHYSYNLIMNDGNLAAGQQMTVDGATLRTDEILTFNGSAELNGSFRVFGGTGNDTIVGSAGNDILSGGLGTDSLTGNAGSDTFLYRNVAESTPAGHDTIQDFALGDIIDLAQIDADTTLAGDQAFTFIGTGAFDGSHPGELRMVNTAGSTWLVQGDINGDLVADFEMVIILSDAHPITAIDFHL